MAFLALMEKDIADVGYRALVLSTVLGISAFISCQIREKADVSKTATVPDIRPMQAVSNLDTFAGGAEITAPITREESSFRGSLFHPAAWTADLK